jgi:hypothetical protein
MKNKNRKLMQKVRNFILFDDDEKCMVVFLN